MKSTFFILLNMKTAGGFESYGRFFIGNDRDFAYSLFAGLQGTETINEENILHLDLVEMADHLPMNIRMLNCTLDQLTWNCRTVTKEIFKMLNLEEM